MLTLVSTQKSRSTGPRVPSKPLAERDFLVYKLLAFDGQATESYRRVSFAQATSGLVAFGATGSGKTAGFMLPALKALASNDCPGLVLDVKGDYVLHLSKICPDRTIVIGPSKNARPVNLIAGISLEVFTTLISGMRINSDSRHGSYWGSAAVEDANLVFVAIRHYESRAPTLGDIAEALSQPVEFGAKLKDWMAHDGQVPEQVLRMHKRRMADKFSLVNFAVRGDESSDTAREQYSWHINHLLPSLLPFLDNEAVRETLCAADVPNWADMIYGENKIIAFDMPSSIFGSVAFTASKIVRLLVMSAILSDTRKFEAGSGFGIEKFSFILADEYQEYISTGTGRGLINDNTFFDRSRSFHHINVVATQGVSSLIAQAGEADTNSVLQNLRTKLFLPTDDVRTLERAEAVASKSYVTMPGFLSNPSRAFSGFLYAPLSDSTFLGSGPVLIGEAGAACPHMAIDRALDGRVRVFEPYQTVPPAPLAELAQAIDANADFVLHVLTTDRSRSLADFAQAVGDAVQMHGSALDAWTDVLARPIVTLISGKSKPGEWLRAMEKIEEDTEASGAKVLLAVIRGGGVSESEFLAFRDPSVMQWVKRVRIEGRVLPMFGISHAQDDFAVHRDAFLAGATPQGLGYRLGYVLSKTSRTQAPAAFSPEGLDSRTEAYAAMATALNALYFSPAASTKTLETVEAVETVEKNAVAVDAPASSDLPVEKPGETQANAPKYVPGYEIVAKPEWERISAGLLKIEEAMGVSTAEANKAIAEFVKDVNIPYPEEPLAPRNAAEVEALINDVIDQLVPALLRKEFDIDAMDNPLPLQIPVVVETQTSSAPETAQPVDPQSSQAKDAAITNPRVELEAPDAGAVDQVAKALQEGIDRLRIFEVFLRRFGDAHWNDRTNAMLSKALDLVQPLVPLSASLAEKTSTLERIHEAMDRMKAASDVIRRLGCRWRGAQWLAVQKTALAILAHLDLKAQPQDPQPVASETAYAMAFLEVCSLQGDLHLAVREGAGEGSTQPTVLAPVLGNVAMFCANLLHHRQMSVVLSDPRYDEPVDWSFLPAEDELLMAIRFPLLKDICMARTLDVLELELTNASTIKTVIDWLDKQHLLHGVIDKEVLAKMDPLPADDSSQNNDQALELPHLLTGTYRVAKLFLEQVEERQRSVLLSKADGDFSRELAAPSPNFGRSE